MRILQIDTGKLWRGGQRQCFLLCGRLSAAGHEVHLVCRRGSPLHERMRGGPVALHPLRCTGEIDPIAAARLAGILRARRPDLLAAQEAHGLGLLALARRLSGIDMPLVYHRRVDVPARRGFGSRWKLGQVDLFVCVSRAVARILEAGGIPRERVRVVHSGTPGFERVSGARVTVCRELGLASSSRLLGTVAGLIPHKGHEVLLEACARLALDREGLHLLVVGDGPLREFLVARTVELGIRPRTHFLGERGDIDRLMSAMDLLVMPSLTEGLGSSILDAFSLELPVVAARAGGIPEIVIDGETGLLSVPGDPQSLAEALRRALEDPQARRSWAAQARRRYVECFTDGAMAEATLECYREAVGI